MVDPSTIPLLLIGAAAFGIVATIAILRRNRKAEEQAGRETPFAIATEGMMRCPSCGSFYMVTDDTCPSCGKRLSS
jgi:hypothetical protein